MSETTKRKVSMAKKLNPTRFWLGKKLSEQHKKKLSETHKGKPTWNKGLKGYKAGEEHYNWKGGAKTAILSVRTSVEYKAWRLDVFQRDWFTCQMPGCAYKGKHIEAHHIKSVKNNPELILDKTNGITLCCDCHKQTRRKEEQFVDLFLNILKLK